MENNLLLTGVDFGGVSPLSLKELKTNSRVYFSMKRMYFTDCRDIIKKGDFSVKPLLIELMESNEKMNLS